MTRPQGVPRDVYDDVVAQRDQALQDRRLAETRYAVLVTEMCALKRHDTGTIPNAAHYAAPDLYASLGPATVLAIEEFAAGSVELRKTLMSTALGLTTQARLNKNADDADRHVAQLIAQGDTA